MSNLTWRDVGQSFTTWENYELPVEFILGAKFKGSYKSGGKKSLTPKKSIAKIADDVTLVNLTARSEAKDFLGKSGIYVHKFKDGSVYIGKASDLGDRAWKSLRELADPNSSKYKGIHKMSDYKESDFIEFNSEIYENLDHMEGHYLNNVYNFRKEGATNILNKKQTDNWELYKDL